jgi:hypothetical protein
MKPNMSDEITVSFESKTGIIPVQMIIAAVSHKQECIMCHIERQPGRSAKAKISREVLENG